RACCDRGILVLKTQLIQIYLGFEKVIRSDVPFGLQKHAFTAGARQCAEHCDETSDRLGVAFLLQSVPAPADFLLQRPPLFRAGFAEDALYSPLGPHLRPGSHAGLVDYRHRFAIACLPELYIRRERIEQLTLAFSSLGKKAKIPGLAALLLLLQFVSL